MAQPVIFISYSHKDEREKDRLLSHLGVLQRQGLIGLWSDDRIGAGADWEKEINEIMAQARVAILLISANFLTSDFILGEEVPILLKRRQSEGLTVFPVIAKACAWQEVEWLTGMNVRPKNGRPIWGAGSRRVDEDLADIAKEVAAMVKIGAPITPTAGGIHKYNQHYPYTIEVSEPQPATSPSLKQIPVEVVRPQPAPSPHPRQIVPFLLLGTTVTVCLLLISAAFVVLPKLWPGVATTPVEQAAEFAPTTASVAPTSPPPNATAVTAPTVVTPPVEVIAAQNTAIANAVIVVEEDFSSNTKGWFEDQRSEKWGDFSERFLDGRYRSTFKSKQTCPACFFVGAWVRNLAVRDLRLSLEVKIIEVSNMRDTHIVIRFRENERGDYYSLWFNLDNTYELWLLKDKKWHSLQKASSSDSFKLEPGVSNTFEIVAAGSQFAIYANNQLLTTVTNPELNEPGKVWFGSNLGQADEVVTVDFDNLVIAEIPLDKTKPEIEATATAVAIAAATARAAPTATEIARTTAEANAIANADILFQDDFSANSHDWWTGEIDDDFGFSETQLAGGKYRRMIKSKGGSFFMFSVPDFLSRDFWLQVEATLVETSTKAGNAGVGITFRKNQMKNYDYGDYYQVTFSNDGTFRVDLQQNGEWVPSAIQDTTSSPVINLEPGVSNTFAILVKGSVFTLYTNGQKLTTVSDIALSEAGEIGLGIGLAEADQTLTVDFDNLVIKAAP